MELPQHVLRFWETKFSQIRPLKRGGGRRYYRPEDMALLRRIRQLLYDDGYTIRGVQKLLRENGFKAATRAAEEARTAAPPQPPDSGIESRRRVELETLLAELEEMRRLLRGSGSG